MKVSIKLSNWIVNFAYKMIINYLKCIRNISTVNVINSQITYRNYQKLPNNKYFTDFTLK